MRNVSICWNRLMKALRQMTDHRLFCSSLFSGYSTPCPQTQPPQQHYASSVSTTSFPQPPYTLDGWSLLPSSYDPRIQSYRSSVHSLASYQPYGINKLFASSSIPTGITPSTSNNQTIFSPSNNVPLPSMLSGDTQSMATLTPPSNELSLRFSDRVDRAELDPTKRLEQSLRLKSPDTYNVTSYPL